jgi:hypothetical protein
MATTGTDILTYMTPNPTWSKSNHLGIPGGQPTYTEVSGNMIWDMKGPSGYPWDGNSYDDNYIYQSITENVWTSPTTFKMFASKTWPNGNGGIVWAPRYFTPGGFNPPIVTADSSYRVYSSCSAYVTQALGGPVETQVQGPYMIDFGGSIGSQLAIVQTYKWGWSESVGYQNQEVNYYVQCWGHVQWELWTLSGGLYTIKQTSAFNTQFAGGSPAVNFPCGVPTI